MFENSPLDIFHNPAFSCSTRFSVEMQISRLYQLSEFDVLQLGVAYRTSSLQVTAATAQIRSNDYYDESCSELALRYGFGEKLSIGAGIERQSLNFGEGYRSLNLYSLSVGLTIFPIPRLAMSASFLNINRPRFEDQFDEFPFRCELNLSYQAADAFTFALAHHIDSRMPDRFSIAQIIGVSKELNLLIGLQTEPLEISGGISLKLSAFKFEYAYRNNVYLDGTHSAGLRYTR